MNAGLILFLILFLCLVIGVPVSISLSVASLTAVVFGAFRPPPRLSPKDLWRAAVQLYHGHCIFVLAGNLMTKGGFPGGL